MVISRAVGTLVIFYVQVVQRCYQRGEVAKVLRGSMEEDYTNGFCWLESAA